MSIEVETKMTLKIGDKKIELTREEAIALRDALNTELQKEPNTTFVSAPYPVYPLGTWPYVLTYPTPTYVGTPNYGPICRVSSGTVYGQNPGSAGVYAANTLRTTAPQNSVTNADVGSWINTAGHAMREVNCVN